MNLPIHSLFRPAVLGTLEVPNRFVASAVHLGGASAEGALSPLLAARWEGLAAGGAGTVIPGAAFVEPRGRFLPGQWSLGEDAREGDVQDLSRRIHRQGARLVVQLAHGGFLRHPALGDGATPGPSEGADPLWGRRIHPLSERDLEAIRESFAAAALRAVRGGADGVELHAAHGTLPAQFLSPLWNRREDRFGGSPENRRRFLSELVRTLRETLPASTPLWVKLSLSEEVPGGYDLQEGLEAALACLDGGAEVLEVSSGSLYSPPALAPWRVGISTGPSEAPFASHARALRARRPQAPLVLTGGLRSLPTLGALLEEGVAQGFGLCRPLLAEPDLVNRWREDDARPAACFSCNACLKGAGPGLVDCPVQRERMEGCWESRDLD